ncbi:MAG: ABC transporter substrate-binding protein [Deltaproteobacteria bacterium]|nr:ABC transporter substrate-binding protein [Deltaproteobacteria bacterium]MBW2065292.1 ABC transporter substrate-binding protein [Deltaproteobacteria bacterium]
MNTLIMRRHRTQMIACLAALLVAGLLSLQAAMASDHYGGTLIVGIQKDIRPLDVHTQRGYLVMFSAMQTHNYMARMTGDGTVEPRLATSWEHSPDGKTWILHLRKGVKFADGTDFDAAAVKWNLERCLKTQYRPDVQIAQAIEPLDTHTIRITLTEPTYYIAYLTGGIFTIKFISPTAVQKYGKDFVNHPNGTGPYMFESLTKDGTLTMVRNPYYWCEKPYMDRIVFKSFRDVRAKHNALRAGEIDFEVGVQHATAEIIKKDPRLTLYVGPMTGGVNLAVNWTMKPWDDERVRKAVLGYAVDRETIAKNVYFGYGKPKVSSGIMMPPYYKDYNDLYPYDLDKAKKLLEEAGFIGKEITFTINNTQQAYKNIAAVLKGSLDRIGVTLKIQTLDYQTWIKNFYFAHKIPFSTTFNVYEDPRIFHQIYGPGRRINPTQMGLSMEQDPKLLTILAEARRELDPKKRLEKYGKLTELFVQRANPMGVTAYPVLHAFKKELKGFTYSGPNMVLDKVYWEK